MTVLARLLLLTALGSASLSAAVSVGSCFGDHMVLQRDVPVAWWGNGAPGATLTVRIGDRPAITGLVAADGTWRVVSPAAPAGGPWVVTISAGKDEVRLNDVLCGEVWLCSGQSNMEMTIGDLADADQLAAQATDGQIRQLLVPHLPASEPVSGFSAGWTVCAPDTASAFTVCGYGLARELRRRLDVPIGLIDASWGGTRIEPWIPPAGYAQVPELHDIQQLLQGLDPHDPGFRAALAEHLKAIEAWAAHTRGALQDGSPVTCPPEPPLAIRPLASRPEPEQQPTTLFHGMIHPLVGYALRGAIWYQGEGNHDEDGIYTAKMRALIGGWRQAWGGEFPFYFVQIAPFAYDGEDAAVLPRFWAAQTAALAIPGTGMVVASDITNPNDVHGSDKLEIGRRLARWALARTYGKADVVCEGPFAIGLRAEGAAVRVTFRNAVGLRTRDGKAPDWFEVAGSDGVFAPAKAAIAGDAVLLSSPRVAAPVAARCAHGSIAQPNLVNGAGLPVVPFAIGPVR